MEEMMSTEFVVKERLHGLVDPFSLLPAEPPWDYQIPLGKTLVTLEIRQQGPVPVCAMAAPILRSVPLSNRLAIFVSKRALYGELGHYTLLQAADDQPVELAFVVNLPGNSLVPLEFLYCLKMTAAVGSAADETLEAHLGGKRWFDDSMPNSEYLRDIQVKNDGKLHDLWTTVTSA
jgi:hypothetical protein